jgi:NADPH2:quinone reductase
MKAAWYEKQGAARDVLTVGETDEPQPLAGEVRIRVAASGVNPGDVKKRQNAFGVGMPYPRIIPHSDGAGTIDAVGEGVSPEWIRRRVWCYGAQTYRPFGTAAEYTVVPLAQAVPLPETVPLEQGACLGISGITAYRAVHVAGLVKGRTCWCKAVRVLLGLAQFNSRIEPERESLRLVVLKAIRKSLPVLVRIRSC